MKVLIHFKFILLQALWFGGDAASIIGECACPHGMNWNDYELECRQNFFSRNHAYRLNRHIYLDLIVLLLWLFLLGEKNVFVKRYYCYLIT